MNHDGGWRTTHTKTLRWGQSWWHCQTKNSMAATGCERGRAVCKETSVLGQSQTTESLAAMGRSLVFMLMAMAIIQVFIQWKRKGWCIPLKDDSRQHWEGTGDKPMWKRVIDLLEVCCCGVHTWWCFGIQSSKYLQKGRLYIPASIISIFSLQAFM